MGFLDFLSPALTAATTAAGAQQQGQVLGNQRNMDNTMTLASLVRQKSLDDQTRLNADAERRLKGTEADYYTSGVAERNSQIEDRRVKGLTNKRAHGALSAQFPTHVLAAGQFDEGTDYTSALKEAQAVDLDSKKALRTAQADYNTLKLEFPNSPLAKAPFNATNPANYTNALTTERQGRALTNSTEIANKNHWVATGNLDPTTGHMIYLNQATGEEKVGGGVKAAGAGGGMTGAQTPVGDMDQRYKEITDASQELAGKKWNITPGMQMREGLTYGIASDAAEGHPSLGKQLAANTIDWFGGAGKPDDFAKYQALMNSQRAFGDDAAKAFKGRQNERAVVREVATLQLTPDDYRNPAVVQRKLSRMKEIIEMARLSQPSGQAHPGGQVHTSATTAPPSFEDWKKQNGVP